MFYGISPGLVSVWATQNSYSIIVTIICFGDKLVNIHTVPINERGFCLLVTVKNGFKGCGSGNTGKFPDFVR